MINFEIHKIREDTKILVPIADFDGSYVFYYDETNNIRKFYVKENGFNAAFTSNFILGGLVHEGTAPDVQPLIENFKLQKTTKEIKLKHIAKGNFIDCLKSKKLRLFFQFLSESNLYIHYYSLNILYWAIVDIVDSAIVNSEYAISLGLEFVNNLKNDLYKLSRLEIDSIIELFFRYEYPNIKSDKIISFIEDLVCLFDNYIDNSEYCFGLESLRQLLKEARKNRDLPFVMNEQDYILLNDLSMFYLRPIYLFKNSQHIFDNEDSISEILDDFKILDNGNEIKNYCFVDSQLNSLIQLSDVFVGIMGKFKRYLNTSSIDQIYQDLNKLSEIQQENLDLFIAVINKSENKNVGFIHNTDSMEELSKMRQVWETRK